MSILNDAEGFDWDDDTVENGNVAHLAVRHISPSDAEEVYANQVRLRRNRRDRSGDWQVIGPTEAGRMLTLVLVYDERRRMIRIFTGWDSTAEERGGV